jgi:SAM-dependent methyltransferase
VCRERVGGFSHLAVVWGVVMDEVNRYRAAAVRLYPVLIDPLLRPLRPRIVSLCRELEVRSVLDIASATGEQCRLLARAGFDVTGLDLSPGMVAHARNRGGGPQYVEGSAYSLPFEDGSFDAVLLLLALHEHTEPERDAMAHEALRVTTRDGWMIIADYTRPTRPSIHLPWAAIRAIETIAGEEHRAGFRDFVRRGALGGLLDRHGLVAERSIRSHFGTIGIAVVPKGERGAKGPPGGE